MPLGNVQNLKENVRYWVRSEVTSVEQMIHTRVYLPISSCFVPFPHPNSFQTLTNRALVLGKKNTVRRAYQPWLSSSLDRWDVWSEEPTHSKHPKKRLNLLSVRDAKGSVTWCRKKVPLGIGFQWSPRLGHLQVIDLGGNQGGPQGQSLRCSRFAVFFLHTSPTLGLVA